MTTHLLMLAVGLFLGGFLGFSYGARVKADLGVIGAAVARVEAALKVLKG